MPQPGHSLLFHISQTGPENHNPKTIEDREGTTGSHKAERASGIRRIQVLVRQLRLRQARLREEQSKEVAELRPKRLPRSRQMGLQRYVSEIGMWMKMGNLKGAPSKEHTPAWIDSCD